MLATKMTTDNVNLYLAAFIFCVLKYFIVCYYVDSFDSAVQLL